MVFILEGKFYEIPSFELIMVHSILITQSLQNDMIKPIGKYDPLPNLLHIGYEEARRLMGFNPKEGPLNLMMKWAYKQPPGDLSIIHIRDWHDPADKKQEHHFHQFGGHCIKDTDGAEFAFKIKNPDRPVSIINSPSLNDFIGTELMDLLNSLKMKGTIKIGLVGVWTEAKIFFLAYELTTRLPEAQIGVCSALTASSSRAHHFLALEQLKRLLGVQIFSSIGKFMDFLTGTSTEMELPAPTHSDLPIIKTTGEDKIDISLVDTRLIRYLFRNCKEVTIKLLTGGFSGNLVLACESIDLHGHSEVPHVVKIGPQEPIGQERTSFERIEAVLGNNAPRITDFADFQDRGALKYRYASMGGNFANTFQKLYMSGLPTQKCEQYLDNVFNDQLGRFYRAATLEHVNLMDHYGVLPKFAESIREFIEGVIEKPALDKTLELTTGTVISNPYWFYKKDLPELFDRAEHTTHISFVHGDLNGANIIVDSHENIWLIDFFHTDRGHSLKDLIKLENDILYIYTPINNEAELKAAMRLTDLLLEVEDLRKPLPDISRLNLLHTGIRRAYETISILRSYYSELVEEDRNVNQLLIAQIRYAGHTLIFDESNRWQKLWALYTLSRACEELKERLQKRGPLRVDWIDPDFTPPGKIGITILPGRKDYSRSLPDDLQALKEQGVTHVLSLLTIDELELYGSETLLTDLVEEGFTGYFFPIVDQAITSFKEMDALVVWLHSNLSAGANIMVHCVGGLGRSGLVVACYLITKGMDATSAIREVRRVRTERAIESKIQEDFVKRYVYHHQANKYFK